MDVPTEARTVPNEKPITWNGVTLTLTAWAHRTKIPASTIRSRLLARWPFDRVFTEPPDRRFRKGGRLKKGTPRPCPTLREHATGQAFVRWVQAGKEHYLYFGPWGSDQAAREYRRFAAEWTAGGATILAAGDEPCVGDLVVAWLAHCERTYRKRDKITSEVHCNRAAMAPLSELYGDTPTAEFDPPKFLAVREQMAARWASRKTVNDHAARVVRMFGWGATMKLVPLQVHELLLRVEPIAAGRTHLAEPKKRQPVPDEHITAVIPHLHPRKRRRAVYEAMVRVQWLTGMRPGELATFRPEDIDRRRTPWKYQVTEFNKMLHRDVERTVYFGPRAREILGPLLDAAEPGKPVFRLPPWRKKADWSPISVVRYRNRIRLACLAAGVPVWTPHRLRHNKATDVMEMYEDDRAAGAAIGDSPEVARQVYAANPGDAVARRIAEATG